jgi:multiple sugar transport system substrate-binding protein
MINSFSHTSASVRRVITTLTIASTLLALNLPAVTVAQASASTVVIRVGTGDSGEGLSPHQDLINAFEKANPDILVQLEPIAGSDYYERLFTEIDAGAAPDIIQIGDDAVPQFVNKGALLDLTAFSTGKYPLDASIYLPGLLAPGQYKGKQYLLPKDYSSLAVYYNKKLFDKYQVPYPKDGWTWADFLKTAQALTKPEDGVYGVQLPGAWTGGFEYWIAAAGGSLIDKDGKNFVGYFDSAATAKAVQFYADLYNKYKVAPPVVDISVSFGGGNTEFDTGKAAMRIFGHWPQAGLLKNPAIDLATVGLPAGDKRANVLFWGGFGITKSSKNAEAAWRFLSYYTGAKAAETWKAWGLPTVTSVASTLPTVDKTWVAELNYLAPRAYTFTDFWSVAADPALSTVLQKVILDPNADVPAILKEQAKAAQDALTKAQAGQ